MLLGLFPSMVGGTKSRNTRRSEKACGCGAVRNHVRATFICFIFIAFVFLKTGAFLFFFFVGTSARVFFSVSER